MIFSYFRSLLQRLRFGPSSTQEKITSEDRSFLEDVIFQWLAQDPSRQNILFAGIQLYTATYPQYFPDQLFYTIDFDSRNEPHGSPGRHVIGDVTRLSDYYAPAQFDCVIFNGLIGFGLNRKSQVEKALEQARIVLKPGGVLILGWNDVAEKTPYPLNSLEALQKFLPFSPEFLPAYAHRHLTNTPWRHTFDFYIRRPVP